MKEIKEKISKIDLHSRLFMKNGEFIYITNITENDQQHWECVVTTCKRSVDIG